MIAAATTVEESDALAALGDDESTTRSRATVSDDVPATSPGVALLPERWCRPHADIAARRDQPSRQHSSEELMTAVMAATAIGRFDATGGRVISAPPKPMFGHAGLELERGGRRSP